MSHPAVINLITHYIHHDEKDEDGVIMLLEANKSKQELISALQEMDTFLDREPLGAYEHWTKGKLASSIMMAYNQVEFEVVEEDDEDYLELVEDGEWTDEDEKLAQEGYASDDWDGEEEEDGEEPWSVDVDKEAELMEQEISNFFGGERGVAWDIVDPSETLGTPAEAGILAGRAENEENQTHPQGTLGDKWDTTGEEPLESLENDSTQEIEQVSDEREPQWYDRLIVRKGKDQSLNKAKTIEAMAGHFNGVEFKDSDGNVTKPTAKQLAELIAPILIDEFPGTKMNVGYVKAYIDYLINAGRLSL